MSPKNPKRAKPEPEPGQGLLAVIHRTQAALEAQRLQVLELDAQLDLAREVSAREPDAASEAAVRQLEAVRQMTAELERQSREQLDELWKHVP